MKHLVFSFTSRSPRLSLHAILVSLTAAATAQALPFADHKVIVVDTGEQVVTTPITPADGTDGVSVMNPFVIKRGEGTLIVDSSGKIDYWTASVVEEGTLVISGEHWAGSEGYVKDGVTYMHGTALGYNVGGDGAALIIRDGAKIYHTDFSNIGTYNGDATVSVTGENTYWNNGNCLFIGGNGFYHNNMAYKPSSGSATNGGKAGFTISDGAVVEAGAASLNSIAGRQVHIGHSGEAVLTVEGEGSQFIAHGYVSVGTFGALESKKDTWGPAEGHLRIADKGSVLITNQFATDGASADLIAGYYSGTTGNVSVTGGSSLTVAGGDAYIGAALPAYSGYLAGTTTAGLYVDDESRVDVSGDAVFAMGKDADATLEIKGGSAVGIGGSTWLGMAVDSTTRALVSGEESRFDAGTNLYLGVGENGSADGGEASLLVDDSANVQATGSYRSGSDSALTIRDAGKVSVGSGFAMTDAFQVDGEANASIRGTVDIDAAQARHGMSATQGGRIVLNDTALLKIRAQSGKCLLYTDIASSLSGSAKCDLIGQIRNEGTSDLTMTAGSVFVGNTAMPSGTFRLALEESVWQLDASSTLSTISSADDSTLIFTIFGQDDFYAILATAASLHDTTVKVILDGYAAIEWDSFCLVDASSYDIADIRFDFSQAVLAPGLEWNVDDFSTQGIIKILAATPVPEPAGLTMALAGLAGLAAARRRMNGFTC